MAIITIARQLGSGGSCIAAKVAEALEYDLIDKGIIVRISEASGLTVNHIQSLDESYESKTHSWLRWLVTPQITRIVQANEKYLKHTEYMAYVEKTINDLADKGNVVIVGRAGQFILKERDDAFHVRIIADLHDRIYRLMEYYGISESEAQYRIKSSDSMREKYIAQYFLGKWDNPLAYHIVVNTSKLGIDEATRLIIDGGRRFGTLREYVPGIKDRRKEHNRRSNDRRGVERRTGQSLLSTRELEYSLLRGRHLRGFIGCDRRKDDRRHYKRRKTDKILSPQIDNKNTEIKTLS